MNEPRKPNVIVFFTDQQRWDTTGVHGNPLGLTPNFDRMARSGTDVHYTFTAQPVCAPSRACLQTGLYATNTGVFRNGIVLDPELGNAGQVLPRRRLHHRLHRQVAPGRRRPGARRAAGGLPGMAGRQPAGVHLRRLRHAPLRHRRQPGPAAGLPCRRPDRCGDSLCRFTPGRTLLPVCLLPGAAPSEPPGRLSRAGGLP